MGQPTEQKDANRLTNSQRVAQFEQQNHRFEFRGRHLFYNGQQVKVDQPLTYYEKIFGTDYTAIRHGDILLYNNIPFSLHKGVDEIVDSIRLCLYYNDQDMLNDKHRGEGFYYRSVLDSSYVMINSVAINKNTNDITLFNAQLEQKGARAFAAGIEGGGSIHRQYANPNTGDWTERITIDSVINGLSAIAYISYGKWGD